MRFNYILLSLALLVLFVAGVLSGCTTGSSQAGKSSEFSNREWRTKTIASGSDLDRVIRQLQNPATRFAAFQSLLEFAGYPRGNIYSSDPKVNALHEKAIQAIQTCPGLDEIITTMIDRLNDPDERLPMLRALLWFSSPVGAMPGFHLNDPYSNLAVRAREAASGAFDLPTDEKAMMDSDWLLRIATVKHFGNPAGDAGKSEKINTWKPLLPQLEKLAVADDSAIRLAADEKLEEFPGTEKFLSERLTNETSPYVIMDILRDRVVGNELGNRFLPLFVPLLSHPDEKVRIDALAFVGSNSGRAPVLQFNFGSDVFDRVIVSTQTKSAQERSEAVYALEDIRRLDPDRSRETFLRLARDPDQDVRWQVAAGLADQSDRADVKRPLAALLKDKSPTVRFFTILAVGPRKCVPQLQELTRVRDSEVAGWAADKLKQIGVTQ